MLKEKQKLTLPCAVFCAVLAAVLAWRWQRIFYLGCANYILTDMPDHIRLAMEHKDYSLCSYLIRLLWAVGGEHFGQLALSLILTANQFFGILTLWLLLRRMFPELERSYALLAVMLAHLCGPWIFPGQTEMYLGAFNGNRYHNMTVLFSRSFVPFDLIFFFQLWDARREQLRFRDWLDLALCLLVTTLFKPSFLGAFAPAVFMLLVWDFCKTKARCFRNEFFIGLAFIPSLLALMWISRILFAEDFAGEGSGVILRPMTLQTLIFLLVMYLRSTLLPLWTFTLQGRRETAQRTHLGIFVFTLTVAVTEALLLTETGARFNHGNFEWGSLAMYPALFSLAIALLFRMFPTEERPARRRWIFFLAGLVLLLGHLVIGVYCLSRPGRTGFLWYAF